MAPSTSGSAAVSATIAGAHAPDYFHRFADHAPQLRQVERLLLPRVLRHTRGHQSQASDLLGLNRATLRHKLRALGLAVDKVVSDEPRRETSGPERAPE